MSTISLPNAQNGRNSRGAEVAYPATLYLCTSGPDVIDTGRSLLDFVAAQQEAWGDLREEHLAVWKYTETGYVLVAQLYADLHGRTRVRWMV